MEYYAELYGDDEFPDSLVYELYNTGEGNAVPWLCPNITKDETYSLGHDPILSFGSNFNFVINECQYAATVSPAEKLNCETDE